MTASDISQKLHIDKGKTLTTKGSKYLIIRAIGLGKNNVVYYALGIEGLRKGMFVAIKIQYNLEGKRVKRFFREVSFLRQHQHLYTVKYYDEGYYQVTNKRYPFVVISYLPYTLEDYIINFEMSFEKKLCFACQMASVLCWLKRLNTLHRDIKPLNILTDGENAVLGDFGLIKNLNKERLLISEWDDGEAEDILDISDTIPRFYRTPELVRFAKKEDILRIESDTFQMGLVYGRLFTGKNPLQPSKMKLDDLNISFSEVDEYNVEYRIVKRLNCLIRKMLNMDYNIRATPEYVLQEMMEVYKIYAVYP
ncbi:protein kinase domain-containing protein [Zhenpiania hominis]|uniref:non-specific serine/threonine protein kinase n=1 Tax=Zhenpiania hominis TaxID=2763644 RepID=A0A923NKE7_9FIRM|nr:protein kinase [Zhenpiania hominis]MBC6679581.1 protein kinase [Zhenpiania hominis]